DAPAHAVGAWADLDRVLVAGAPASGRRRPERRPGGRVLGFDQPAGLGRLRVRAARPGQPALRTWALRAERGRGGPGGHDGLTGIPRASVGLSAAPPLPARDGWPVVIRGYGHRQTIRRGVERARGQSEDGVEEGPGLRVLRPGDDLGRRSLL